MAKRYIDDDGLLHTCDLIWTRGNDGYWHSTTQDRDQEWLVTPIQPHEKENDTADYDYYYDD